MSRWRIGFFGLAFTFLIAAVLFGSAGRWDMPWFGVYLGLWLLFTLITAATVDLDLMKERLRPRAAGRDSLLLLRLLATASLGGHFVVAGLDVGRYHWSNTVPLGAQVLGLIGLAAALATIRWTQHVNRFFSSAMRIQRDRGQHVITGGPYQYVRHPGYAAFILVALCSGVALGSWGSLLPPLLYIGLFIRRTAMEDRLLREELEGYSAYAGKVRYRLLPGLW
jgi:protein-S-isoprenylcysteine O-methyltransferase Ste14